MRENRLSGLASGAWKRGTESLLRHRQTKGPETDKTLLNYRATPRLYILGVGEERWWSRRRGADRQYMIRLHEGR